MAAELVSQVPVYLQFQCFSNFSILLFVFFLGCSILSQFHLIVFLFFNYFAGLGLCVLNPLSVALTDFADVEPLLNANIELNCIMLKDIALQDCVRSRFFAMPFSWGTDLLSLPENNVIRGNKLSSLLDVDVVIASDVVYDPVGYEPLVKSLCDLLGGEYRQWNGGDSSTVVGRFDVKGDRSTPEIIDRDGNNDDNDNSKNNDTEKTPFPLCILAHRHRHPENQR